MSISTNELFRFAKVTSKTLDEVASVPWMALRSSGLKVVIRNCDLAES